MTMLKHAPRRIRAAIAFAGAVTIAAGFALAADCTQTSTGLVPLTDLGTNAYLGAKGGLYPGGQNAPPPAHFIAGKQLADSIVPLNTAGEPDPENGFIVLVSVGMSNTSQEFTRFMQLLNTFGGKHPRLKIVNGAQGGQEVTSTSNPDSKFWNVLNQRLAQQGLTPQQVQVVWLKQAKAQPTGGFNTSMNALKDGLIATAQNIKMHLPNTKLCYVSSRIYAGYASTLLNPEPYAYESGFAVKGMIVEQMAGNPALNFNPDFGEVKAPWLAWGPYLWADGLVPRETDQLIYECSDFAPDGTHPSESGREKVANLLINFFASNPTAFPQSHWFLSPTPPKTGDLNGNGIVNVQDLLTLLAAWGPCGLPWQSGAGLCLADLDGDGTVGVGDLLILLANWG